MEENKLHYHMKVRVFRKEGAFGPGVAELMHHVEETGSLSEACRCMGMAYSKGWRIMKHAEEDLGFPLMEGSRGGSRGGRTMLTEKGKDFLQRYEMFMAELNRSAGEACAGIYMGYYAKRVTGNEVSSNSYGKKRVKKAYRIDK